MAEENKSSDAAGVVEDKYVVLQETSDEESESWMFFLKYTGNEVAIAHLKSQLEQVEFYLEEYQSTFDIDTEHLVSAQTAKEMTTLDLNSFMYHRKFDDRLQTINFELNRLRAKAKKKGKTKEKLNEAYMRKIHEVIGMGQIEDYIDQEDVDARSGDSGDESSDLELSDDSDDDSADEEIKVPAAAAVKPRSVKKIPASFGGSAAAAAADLPRFAKAKRRKHKPLVKKEHGGGRSE